MDARTTEQTRLITWLLVVLEEQRRATRIRRRVVGRLARYGNAASDGEVRA
jgi:hypothetical protein